MSSLYPLYISTKSKLNIRKKAGVKCAKIQWWNTKKMNEKKFHIPLWIQSRSNLNTKIKFYKSAHKSLHARKYLYMYIWVRTSHVFHISGISVLPTSMVSHTVCNEKGKLSSFLSIYQQNIQTMQTFKFKTEIEASLLVFCKTI